MVRCFIQAFLSKAWPFSFVKWSNLSNFAITRHNIKSKITIVSKKPDFFSNLRPLLDSSWNSASFESLWSPVTCGDQLPYLAPFMCYMFLHFNLNYYVKMKEYHVENCRYNTQNSFHGRMIVKDCESMTNFIQRIWIEQGQHNRSLLWPKCPVNIHRRVYL